MVKFFTIGSCFSSDLPTEREMDLWAELQSTKDTLRLTEDEVTSCKREKVRFLETLTKITVNIASYYCVCCITATADMLLLAAVIDDLASS